MVFIGAMCIVDAHNVRQVIMSWNGTSNHWEPWICTDVSGNEYKYKVRTNVTDWLVDPISELLNFKPTPYNCYTRKHTEKLE